MFFLSLLLACKPSSPQAPQAVLQAKPTQLQAVALSDQLGGALARIAPVEPGQLQPLAGQSGSGLQALMVGPQGEQEQPRQALVVFDREMVALSSLDAAPVPLLCDGVAGSGRWAGTSTAVFVPEQGHFPRSAELVCTVPSGTAAKDGTTLEQDLVFSFRTLAPELTRSLPSAGASQVDPSQPIVLVFNQPVDPEQVLQQLELQGPGKPKLALQPLAEGADIRLPSERSRVVSLFAEMERDSDYKLTLSSKISGTEGPRVSGAQQVIDFSTIPPAGIQKVYPVGDSVDPVTTIRLDLSTQTEAEELGKFVHISPEPPGGWDPADAYSWTTWSYSLRLAPLTTYTVRVDAGAKDSFGQPYAEPMEWSFSTGHLPVLVDAADGKLLYPANNPTKLPVRSRNVQDLYVAVTPVEAGWAIKALDDWESFDSSERTLRTPGVPLAAGRALDDRVHVDMLDLANSLQDGHGFVFVETWSPERRGWRERVVYDKALLQVTDLGTTLKLDHGGVRAWVTRLSDGAPVEQAQVRVYREGSLLWEGQTDAQGLAVSTDVLPKDWNAWDSPVVVLVEHEGDRVLTTTDSLNERGTWDFDIYRGELEPQGFPQLSTFTDRGVYKPGDTVHVAAKARVAHGTGLSIPTESSMTWTCSDPRSVELLQGKGTLDSHGGLAFDLELPGDMPLGSAECSISLSSAEGVAGAWVSILTQAYRAPTFRVELAAPSHAVQGQTVQITGHGNYLFGAPMGGAKVSWTARSIVVEPEIPGWDGYRFGGDESGAWWEHEHEPVQQLADGSATLDEQGALEVSLELPLAGESARPRQVELEFEVQDPARQRVANRAHLMVHPADFYLGLRASTGVGKAGESAGVDLVAVDPQGQAQGGVSVELEIVQRSWDVIRQRAMDGRWRWESAVIDTPMQTLQATSSEQAERLTFVPEVGGYYVLRASAQDAQGRASVSEIGFYVAGPGASWARGDSDQVELVADKRSYKPGDTAQLLVKAPKAGLHAWLTLEREGVLEQRVFKLESASQTLQIPITEQHAPNIFVSLVLTEGAPPADSPKGGMPAHYLGYTELTVSAESRHLKLALQTDKQSYQPGEQVKVSLQADTPQGAAAGARVVLYAVDHGVLSLTGYQTPAPFQEFWGPRSLHVLTADGRTQILDRAALLAKGAPAGGDGGALALRSRFETTPLWVSDLETDEQGHLEYSFTLPDNLTTFRIMAVVDHGPEAFGSAEHELQVSRPLLANPALPRFLRSDDHAIAGVVVHNNLEQERQVEVTGQADGLTLVGSPKSVTVPAHGALEVPFDLSEPQLGAATLEFSVTSGSDTDRVRVTLPVSLPRPVETMATAGVAESLVQQSVELPQGAQPGLGGLSVVVSPTALVGAQASLDYLLDYPHGCLEQTSSRLMSVLLAQELDRQLELKHTPEQLAELREQLLTLMGTFSHPSGGFTMWPGSRSPSPLATAYALEALHRAQAPLPERAVAFLRGFLAGAYAPSWWSPETLRNAQARVGLSLARIGQGDAALNSRLYTDRGALSLSARAGLAESIARTTGADSRSRDLLSELAGHLEIQATYATITDADSSRWIALWEGELAPTAATLRALLVAEPSSALLPRLVQGLVASRAQGRWGNTYTTLRSMEALADYAARFEDQGLAQSVRVSLGDQQLIDQSFQGPKPQSAQLPMSSLQPGQLSIQPQGRVYWEARLSYGLQSAPPRDQGFTLQRSMLIVQGTGDSGHVTPGALVQITLQITTPVERSFVAVVDPLPAGLEPVNTAFASSASALGETQDTGWGWDTGAAEERTWSDWVFNHREMRDDAMVLYADWMPAGVHTYTYLARATTPGQYQHPPATVEQMYAPEVFGRTGSAEFVVGTPPVAQR